MFRCICVFYMFDMLRLGFFLLFLALMPCHSFICPCINAIGVVLLQGKLRVRHASKMFMHSCHGFLLMICWSMLRCMIRVCNMLMPCSLDQVAALI